MEKKKIIIPVVTIAVIGAVGGTGYYYRDNVIDVATEAFDVVAEKIPFLQSGKSDDKVYVEKVSKIMNTYTGNTNRYNALYRLVFPVYVFIILETFSTYTLSSDFPDCKNGIFSATTSNASVATSITLSR